MDIAALLAPASANPTVDLANASTAVPTAPGEAFSDLLAGAMVETPSPSVDLPIDAAAVLPVPVQGSVVAPPALDPMEMPILISDPGVVLAPEPEKDLFTKEKDLFTKGKEVFTKEKVEVTEKPQKETSAVPNPKIDAVPELKVEKEEGEPTDEKLREADQPPSRPFAPVASKVRRPEAASKSRPPDSPPISLNTELMSEETQTDAPNAPVLRSDRTQKKPAFGMSSGKKEDPASGLEIPVEVYKLGNAAVPTPVEDVLAPLMGLASNGKGDQQLPALESSDPLSRKNSVAVLPRDAVPTAKEVSKARGSTKATVPANVFPAKEVEAVIPAVEVEIPAVAEADSAVPTAPLLRDLQNPRLQSAPDLGIVPKVVIEAPKTGFAVAAASAVSAAVSPTAFTPLTVVPIVSNLSELPKPVNEAVAAHVAEASTPLKVETVETVEDVAVVDTPEVMALDVTSTSGAERDTDAETSGDGEGSAPQSDDSVQIAAGSPTSVARSAATDKPEAGVERPTVDRHLVVRQVADRIENLVASRPRDGVTIHLEPRDLGTVTLVVKGLSSALDVQMFASDDRVRASLDTSRPELAQALAPRGIEVREVRVAATPVSSSGSSMSGEGAGSNPDGRPRNHQPPSSPPQSSFSNSGSRTATASRPRAARSGRGVDLLA